MVNRCSELSVKNTANRNPWLKYVSRSRMAQTKQFLKVCNWRIWWRRKVLPIKTSRYWSKVRLTSCTIVCCFRYFLHKFSETLLHWPMCDGLTDMDECELYNGGCQQLCNNSVGSYACNCESGFVLAPDGRSCNGTSSNHCDPLQFVLFHFDCISIYKGVILAGLDSARLKSHCVLPVCHLWLPYSQRTSSILEALFKYVTLIGMWNTKRRLGRQQNSKIE